jgi:homogentisate 1,2-dioxygenase
MIKYLHGFGNHLQSEAIEGALVTGCNSPQKVPYGLYAEQLSGSAFTLPRTQNLHSWLYRIRPSVLHGEFKLLPHDFLTSPSSAWGITPPTQMRWNPMPYPNHSRDFIQSLVTLAGNGSGDFTLVAKFQGHLWAADLAHSPLDVVAWHGNYVPYKYDLAKFNTMNSVSFDHPDPSIFTVLTSPSYVPGIANVDFVIFPPRWMVASDTFRPPYYHRNIMNEYMGLIHGTYDAKEAGFVPGGGSLHNCMSPHGPDADAFHKAINTSLQPEYYSDILAFMFEAQQVWRLTPYAQTAEFSQKNYLQCWQGLKPNFEKMELS